MNNENRKIKGNIFYYFVKRCFDFLTSFIALTILLLPMIILAIIVKCGSKGPVLFKVCFYCDKIRRDEDFIKRQEACS